MCSVTLRFRGGKKAEIGKTTQQRRSEHSESFRYSYRYWGNERRFTREREPWGRLNDGGGNECIRMPRRTGYMDQLHNTSNTKKKFKEDGENKRGISVLRYNVRKRQTTTTAQVTELPIPCE